MNLFLVFLGLCFAVSGVLWWLFSVDALLLIILHPVLWALVMLAVAGVTRAEERDDARP